MDIFMFNFCTQSSVVSVVGAVVVETIASMARFRPRLGHNARTVKQ
nr:MAG TPA_asm: hypothetical protein [Caudoviricetes sp.]